MVNINLLPWRAQQKQYEARMLKNFLLCSCCVSLSLLLLSHLILGYQIDNARRDQAKIQQGLDSFGQVSSSEEGDKTALSTEDVNMMLIHEHMLKKLFMMLSTYPAESICFNNIRHHNHTITFTGYARSAILLTDFLKQWTVASLFSEIQMDHIKQLSHGPVEFDFHALEK